MKVIFKNINCMYCVVIFLYPLPPSPPFFILLPQQLFLPDRHMAVHTHFYFLYMCFSILINIFIPLFCFIIFLNKGGCYFF